MEEIEVFIEKCREGVELPRYANFGDAGMDVCAAEDITINPGQTAIIPTGLKVAIPLGYEIQVRPRSGISVKNPLRIPNSPGTIAKGCILGIFPALRLLIDSTSSQSSNPV